MTLEAPSTLPQPELDPRVAVFQSAEASSVDKEIAFSQIVFEYQPMLLRYVRNLVHSDEVAADLVQEVLLRAWRAMENYRAEANLSAWLFTIAYNRVIDYVREQKRRPSIAAMAIEEFFDIPSTAPEPETWAETTETIDTLTEALHHLDPAVRETVLLRDVQGLSYKEIAEQLQIPMASVKWRIYAGRDVLAESITKKAA